MRKLCHAKFEGVVVDLMNEDQGLSLLRELRQLTSHKAVVAFALVYHDFQKAAAFQAGANFLFDRPLSTAAIARTIRASYPLMVRERRRYYRCAWETRVDVERYHGQKFTVTSLNISETGIALLTTMPLQVGEHIGLRFHLPDEGELRLSGDVCWVDASGRTGIQFKDVTRQAAESLQRWLEVQLDGILPLCSGCESRTSIV